MICVKICISSFKGWLTVLLMGLFLVQCSPKNQESNPVTSSSLNTAHLDELYEEIRMAGDTVGIIHLYSMYPDYHIADDTLNGMASVSDASAAAVFYLLQYQNTGDPEYLRKGRMLLKFLLAMHAPDGYFYNYIWKDTRIHADGMQSKAVPAWWSWQVLWAFGEVLDILDPQDQLTYMISRYRNILINTVIHDGHFGSKATETAMGITIPTWLPQGDAADEAALLIVGMTKALQQPSYSVNLDKADVIAHIRHFAAGIMMMQVDAPGTTQDGAFLSYDNIWKSMDNLQAYALLTAGQQLKDTTMIQSALREINTYYPSMLKQGLMNEWSIKKEGGKLIPFDSRPFPQEVSGWRPMVWACLKAYEIKGEHHYLDLAKAGSAWLNGENPAHQAMYDPTTGRTFDAISKEGEVNKNSSGRTTIEALLIMQALEEYTSHH